jgi:hypothetical protein
MIITDIKELGYYISRNSGFSLTTVSNVLEALGYSLDDGGEAISEVSADLENCAEHGAECGFSGFIYYNETIAFYKENRQDIVKHMEQTAAEFGTDIISMVQDFGVFRNGDKPGPSDVGRALWDSTIHDGLTSLYNVFAWYALEEVSRTWYGYLEEHPAYHAELSA